MSANAQRTAAEVAALLHEGSDPLPPSDLDPAPPIATGANPDPIPQMLRPDAMDLVEDKVKVQARHAKRNGGKPPELSSVQPATPQQTPQKALASMLPPAQRIHVYRREDNGKMTFLEDYDINDLRGHGTIQAFLKKYLAPKERPRAGQTEVDYHLFIQGHGDKEPRPWGSVQVAIEPHSGNGNGGDADLLKTLHQILTDRTSQQPAKDPIDQLRGLMEVKKQMDDGDGKKGNGDSGMMTTLMLMQLLQPKPQNDPALDLVRRKLEDMDRREEQKALQSALNQPMMAPAPPPEDKIMPLIIAMQDNTTKLLTTMMTQMNQRPDPGPSLLDQIKVVTDLVRPDTPPMGIKDVLELFPKVKEMIIPKDDQKDSFEKMIEHMKLLRLVRDEFVGPAQGQPDGGFWDFAKALVQSDLGNKIAEGIQQDATKNAAKKTKEGEANAEGALVIPESFAEFAKKIDEAPDLPQRIGATFQGLRHLWGFPGFKPHITKLLDLMKQNKKKEAIKQLEEVLSGLAEAEAIKQTSVDEVIKGTRMFWVAICNKLGFPITVDPEAPATVSPAQPVQAQQPSQQPQQAPPVQAAPRPKPAVIEVEDEDPDAVVMTDAEIAAAERKPTPAGAPS